MQNEKTKKRMKSDIMTLKKGVYIKPDAIKPLKMLMNSGNLTDEGQIEELRNQKRKEEKIFKTIYN